MTNKQLKTIADRRAMNKRQALKIGASVCYYHKLTRDQWRTVYPWKTENPHGAKSDSQTRYYRDAVRRTACNVAEVALYQWCESRDIPRACIVEGYVAIWRAREDLCQPGTARHFLNVGIDCVLYAQACTIRCDLLDWVDSLEVAA